MLPPESPPRRRAEPRELILLAESLRLLAEARTLDEVKDIRDKAEALRLYVKQRGESFEVQNAAAEIKIRAERRAGEILKGIDFDQGGGDQKSDHRSQGEIGDRVTLASFGIEKMEASRWQKIAQIPLDDFDAHLEQTKAAGKELTSAGVLRLANQQGDPSSPPAWTLNEAMERLCNAMTAYSEKWPADYRHVLTNKLRDIADEIDRFGSFCS